MIKNKRKNSSAGVALHFIYDVSNEQRNYDSGLIAIWSYLAVAGLPADLDDNVHVILDPLAGAAVDLAPATGPGELVQLLLVLQLGVAVDQESRVILVGQAAGMKGLDGVGRKY